MPVRVVLSCTALDDAAVGQPGDGGGAAVGYFRVEVVDGGVGIAAKDQGRVFGEFAQFNRNKLQGGGMAHFLPCEERTYSR